MEARLSAPLSEKMVSLAGLRPGMRVLDLATGRGEPAILAARRVAPGGSVLGIDVSAAMLRMAAERAAREGVQNLELTVGDGSQMTALTAGSYDAALIRWGLMNIDAPVATLKAVRHALRRGAPLVLAVWAEPERVPYYQLPRRALERYRDVPPVDFRAPGPFRYASPARLRDDLEAANLELRHEEEIDVAVMEAKDGPELVAWARAFGLTQLLEELPEPLQRAWPPFKQKRRSLASELETSTETGLQTWSLRRTQPGAPSTGAKGQAPAPGRSWRSGWDRESFQRPSLFPGWRDRLLEGSSSPT